MTEADARQLGVRPIATSDASLFQLTISQGYHFISLVAIAVILALGFTSFMAVFWSVAIAFVLSMLRADSRLVTPQAFAIGVIVAVSAYAIGRFDGALLPTLLDGRLSVSVFWGIAAATAYAAIQALSAQLASRAPSPDMTGMVTALSDAGARHARHCCDLRLRRHHRLRRQPHRPRPHHLWQSSSSSARGRVSS